LSLDTRAWLALAALGVVMGLLLFVPAGTIHYWQAWVYLAIFIGVSGGTTLYLMKNDPALLQRRMTGGPTGEKERTQKLIMSFESIGFVALLVVPAFDRRYGWSAVPTSVAILGDVLVAVGFLCIVRVYRENSFAAATVEVFANQKVVTTGPYAIVRHPMYASGLLYLVGTPLALGSVWGLVPLAAVTPLLIWRLLDEERLLAERLPGYVEYQERVRCHLVPFVW
jgi:protein-S-isoprenylcysteine O-methyltransferase Ste14